MCKEFMVEGGLAEGLRTTMYRFAVPAGSSVPLSIKTSSCALFLFDGPLEPRSNRLITDVLRFLQNATKTQH